jgi:dienelactone hydrolase
MWRFTLVAIMLFAGLVRAADAPIPYAVDHDAPLDPTERVDTETDTYTRFRVEFNGIRKDRVPAFLYLPKSKVPATTRPAVLLQYGIGGSKKTNYIVALGEQCASRGFIVLTIDAPLKGERKPPKEKRGVLDSLGSAGEQGRFPWYMGDYSRAMDFLMTRPEVDRDRVGYVGISWGAITGITFVAHEPRVRAMASICGGGNFLGTLDNSTVTEESKRAAQRIDPIYHVAQIAPRPLLLLNVTNDQLVPRFYSEALHRAAGDSPSVTKEWIDSDHFFNGVDRIAVMTRVVDFMEESLK